MRFDLFQFLCDFVIQDFIDNVLPNYVQRRAVWQGANVLFMNVVDDGIIVFVLVRHPHCGSLVVSLPCFAFIHCRGWVALRFVGDLAHKCQLCTLRLRTRRR